MSETGEKRFVEISLPADRDMMLVVRLATSGVLARSGLTVDAVDDIKMAIEEGCGCLISQIASPGRLSLRFDIGAGDALATISCEDGCPTGMTMDEAERDVVKCILESLVDRVEISEVSGVIRSIALGKSLP